MHLRIKAIAVIVALTFAVIAIFLYQKPLFHIESGDPVRLTNRYVAQSLEQYRKDFGSFPGTSLSEISSALKGHNTKQRQYMRDRDFDSSGTLVDVWGTPLKIEFQEKVIVVSSAGKNRTFGDDDDKIVEEIIDK